MLPIHHQAGQITALYEAGTPTCTRSPDIAASPHLRAPAGDSRAEEKAAAVHHQARQVAALPEAGTPCEGEGRAE